MQQAEPLGAGSVGSIAELVSHFLNPCLQVIRRAKLAL